MINILIEDEKKSVDKKELIQLFANSKNKSIVLLDIKTNYIIQFVEIFQDYKKHLDAEIISENFSFNFELGYKGVKANSKNDRIYFNNSFAFNIENVSEVFAYDDYLKMIFKNEDMIILEWSY
jgi:hypothetical protein